MLNELVQQLERLEVERRRLESLLGRHAAWHGLVGLDQLRRPVDAAEAAMRQRQRAELERMLHGNPVFEAYRSVMSAIAAIEDLISARHGDLSQQDAPAVDSERAPEVAAPTGAPVPPKTSPDVASVEPRSIELLTIPRSNATPALTRTATIHALPPGRHPPEQAQADRDRPADDLTRIRRIDRALAQALVARGVRHFSDIASFSAADVRALRAALGLGRRISQENWIEQAAVLAMKAAARTAITAPRAPATEATKITDVPALMVAREPEASTTASDATTAAAAQIVARVAAQIAARVHEQADGVFHVEVESAAEATTTQEQSASISVPAPGLGTLESLVREAVLRIAERAAVGVAEDDHDDTAPRMEPTADEPKAITDTDADADAIAPEDDQAPDDLSLIYGIDPSIAAWLVDAGVTRFSDIAGWDSRSVAIARSTLGASVDVCGHGWIEQAAMLAEGRNTVHSQRVLRGEYDALVTYPSESPTRNERFAAWLAAHSQSFADAEESLTPEVPPAQIELPSSVEELPSNTIQQDGEAPAAAVASLTADRTSVEDADELEDLPLPPPAAVLDIAERISAIERDAAKLPMKPRAAPPPPLRPALAQADLVVENQEPVASGERGFEVLGEADVRIVMRETHNAGLEPLGGQRAPAVAADPHADFDKDEYAAYHDKVEEANVEIVRGHEGIADDDELLMPDAAGTTTTATGARQNVRRFLKALRGD